MSLFEQAAYSFSITEARLLVEVITLNT